MEYMIYWAVLFILSIIIEAATAQLLTAWFIAGSFLAMIACLAGAPLVIQVIIFIASSILTAFITIPFMVKAKVNKEAEEPFKKLIGEMAQVVEPLNYITGEGRVLVKGVYWAAEEVNKVNLDIGEIVKVLDVSGAKLLVSKVGAQDTFGSSGNTGNAGNIDISDSIKTGVRKL